MSKTFLIVDDSPAMRQFVSFTIKQAGHDVIAVGHGKDALEKLSSTLIDMVITDYNMPEMDGIELIRHIRDMANYKSTPIIMLTTESQEEKKAEGRAAGASGWIVKPFKPEKLMEVVNRFVK